MKYKKAYNYLRENVLKTKRLFIDNKFHENILPLKMSLKYKNRRVFSKRNIYHKTIDTVIDPEQ